MITQSNAPAIVLPDFCAHTLIQCLTAIARHHGLSLDPEQTINDHRLTTEEPDFAQLQRIAVNAGLTAQSVLLSWQELLQQQGRYPLLARLSNGKGVIVVGAEGEEEAGRVAILDPLESQVGIFWLARQAFCQRWTGETMILEPQTARSSYDQLIAAIALQGQGKLDEAIQLFRDILSREPDHPAALHSLALIALNTGHPDDALHLSASGIQAAPDFAPLRCVHGAALQALGNLEAALRSYDDALNIQPDHLESLINSGVLLRDLFRHHEALKRFNSVLAINPDHPSALANCAILLTEFKQSELAIAMFERLLAIAPDYDYAPGLLCYERLHLCDWRDFERLSQTIVAGIRAGQRSCKTLAFMAISDSAEDHFKAARIFAASYAPRQSVSLWQGERYRHDKIRIAYVSPDLREHPVSHLMAGVFEHHDRARFEIFAISLGIDDHSQLRQRLHRTFDHFIDASLMRSRQIAEKMRAMEIDIAIDLAGYTSDSRLDIFAYRPAPIQASYLGYPGTLGTDYMDYLIADRHVVPEAHQCFYSEKIVYLPNTYLPTDASLVISETIPSRTDCGLPESGIVFCSFSHDYKISPSMFAVWMRLLERIPGSVLWLMSRSDSSQRNLRYAAEQQGIDPARLVFAVRIPRIEDHLARYRQADLFLDTYPYNAHTTAADALMAGLPVITYMGNAFPSRVAGSLLHAIGLPELIADSLADYETLALGLASDPLRLAELKARLAANKATCPLFDTQKFCRNLEAVYLSLYAQQNRYAQQKEEERIYRSEQPMTAPVSERQTAIVLKSQDNLKPNDNLKPDDKLTRSLDLGCGGKPKNPFNAGELFGIDVREDLDANIRRADLAIEPIPFGDRAFDYVSAYDFLEHIPRVIYIPWRRNAFVELMNEIYRVLKTDGLFLSFTPAYPQPAAFQDPTHVNIITDQTFPLYFDHLNRWASGYGFTGAFLIQSQEWRGAHLLTVMQKVALTDDRTTASIADSVSLAPVAKIPSTALSVAPSMVKVHQTHWSQFLDNSRNRALYDSWWNPATVNFWRHTRLLSPVLDLLDDTKAQSWLTIGDGAGSDAWRLLSAGYRSVLATDVDDTVLAQTQQRGYIQKYQVENAEALSFEDDTFDFVLCKESLHHMNRPYAAIYEFLRVARYGVVLIEPQDPWIDWPCQTDATLPHYESVGNYVYQFSIREFEKIAYGLNLTGIATKNLIDVYIPDCEFAYCKENDPVWLEMQRQVAEGEAKVANGTVKPNYIQAVLFKNAISQETFLNLAKRNETWTFKDTKTNPFS